MKDPAAGKSKAQQRPNESVYVNVTEGNDRPDAQSVYLLNPSPTTPKQRSNNANQSVYMGLPSTNAAQSVYCNDPNGIPIEKSTVNKRPSSNETKSAPAQAVQSEFAFNKKGDRGFVVTPVHSTKSEMSWNRLDQFDEDSTRTDAVLSTKGPYDKRSKKADKKASDNDWWAYTGWNDSSAKESIYQKDKSCEADDDQQQPSEINSLSLNSLKHDYKNKKKYDFIVPNNEYFSGRDKAQPILTAVSVRSQPKTTQSSIDDRELVTARGQSPVQTKTPKPTSFIGRLWGSLVSSFYAFDK
ncbi:hypothetical protein M3Y96_01091300 [Aphelenchoides besseyi]|nr:hypothetical protein M3Y96_01091300 [Aphelenchoides besseyi]